MQLKQLQLDIQQRADKTLKKGCLLYRDGSGAFVVGQTPGYGYDVYSENVLYTSQEICGYDDYYDDGVDDGVYEIIGHPMNWGRLCYLSEHEGLPGEPLFDKRVEMFDYFDEDRNRYLQDVTTRDLKTQELVLSFLNTLGPL